MSTIDFFAVTYDKLGFKTMFGRTNRLVAIPWGII